VVGAGGYSGPRELLISGDDDKNGDKEERCGTETAARAVVRGSGLLVLALVLPSASCPLSALLPPDYTLTIPGESSSRKSEKNCRLSGIARTRSTPRPRRRHERAGSRTWGARGRKRGSSCRGCATGVYGARRGGLSGCAHNRGVAVGRRQGGGASEGG
jgi:hypothetical protein